MRMKTIICLSFSLALILGVVLCIQDHSLAAAKQTLTAVYVKEAPGRLDDPAWQKAKAVEIPFEGKEKFAGKKASVTTRALFIPSPSISLAASFSEPAPKTILVGIWKLKARRSL